MKSLYYALTLAVVSACSLNAVTPTPIGGGSTRSGANLAQEQNVRACQGKNAGDACTVSGGMAMFMAKGTCQPTAHHAKPGITGLAPRPQLACTLGKETASKPEARIKPGAPILPK